MADRINVLDHWEEDDTTEGNQPLELVRLGPNQVAAIPFNTDGEAVELHHVEDKEIRGYIHCNAPKCVLCCAGRSTESRVLLPVYLPASGAVGALPISPSSRAGALRPQIMPLLRSGRRVVLLIRKPDNVKFEVATVDLTQDMDDGAAEIKSFQAQWATGNVKLASVFPRLDNRTLAEIPGVGRLLKIKGVKLDDDGNPR